MTDKEKLDKLVAEIKRLKEIAEYNLSHSKMDRGAWMQQASVCTNFLSFLDSMQKEPKECMYSKDNYTDEDRKVLCDGCEEECKFNKKQEPVSEDLESFVRGYREKYWYPDDIDKFIGFAKQIANWQKQKDEKNIGELQWNAHEEGWDECKQEMMAKAVDVTIAIPYQNGYGGYTQLVDSKEALPFGENLKILVIKEN